MAPHQELPTPAVPGAPLLTTKLHLPPPRPGAVARPRLLARLRDGLRGRLTLIAAPAGFGKSTLLAQALEAAPASFAPAWVALDAGDNDPARFWNYVCAALERARPGLGAPALALLRAGPAAEDAAAAEILNALAETPAEIALILDDYHVITAPAIQRQVGVLLEHAPAHFHLLIAGRMDPPLPLARLRARGELVELRAADLRFTLDEALQFLGETMGLRLDAAAVAALEARTEGWVAGLQLAALSLQGQRDVDGAIASFRGSHRHVVDYLAEEVLLRQPEHVRAFLLQTAILERFCGPLCDALLGVDAGHGGDSYSQLILDQLERENLFLIPLDGERRWYRYHHLFADLLRHRLAQERPALVAALHRRAAGWFAQQGEPAAALDHAAAAGDPELLGRLLADHGVRFVASGENVTLQRWLDAVPREALLASPRLCLTQAAVLVGHRRILAAEPYLDAAGAALAAGAGPEAASLRGELLTQRAHVAIERGEHALALALAREAAALLPADDYRVRSSNGLLLGYALMLLGQTGEAVTVYRENVRVSRLAGNAVSGIFSANELIKLRLLQGRLREAQAAAEEALAWVRAAGWQQLPPTSALHIWQANVRIERGELPAADAELATALRLSQAGITSARAHTFLARLRLLEGDAAGAAAALAAVETICRDWEPGGERVFFDAYVARLRLLEGDTAAARAWAAARPAWEPGEAPGYFREIELLSLARVAILAAEDEPGPGAPLAMLARLREQAAAAGRGAVVIEALALEALALQGLGCPAEALQRLDEALARAAPEGFVGLLADLGPQLAQLVALSAGRRPQGDPLQPYLRRLLAACAHPDSETRGPAQQGEAPVLPASAEHLTERELEVLRLFVAGMTSAEIAGRFVVSVNTVKTQLKSIYGKLDVHSRAELVARARDLELIP